MNQPRVRAVPEIAFTIAGNGARATPSQDAAREVVYRDPGHRALPHVVKFSGGRSSAMLLFCLLENRVLDAGRGDVIVFNNTSAEHPDTYTYVTTCMRAARPYGIPFFWTEFQTYEDNRRNAWTRLPTYRLTNDRPLSRVNPRGLHWRGEVYEELLSWSGYVPNQFTRSCTKHLKLEVTRSFLADWFSGRTTTPRLGHRGARPRIDPAARLGIHRRHGGTVPEEIFRREREYTWHRPHVRPAQRFSDFWPGLTAFRNPSTDAAGNAEAPEFRPGGIEYLSIIGLRGDEPQRVERVREREAAGNGDAGEHVYMPLADLKLGRADVNAFWDLQHWDLAQPRDAHLSNCVFCFLKGSENLKRVQARMRDAPTTVVPGFGPLRDTPSDLAWWRRMEAKYGRDLTAEGRRANGRATRIGFFGARKFSYEAVEDGRETAEVRSFNCAE